METKKEFVVYITETLQRKVVVEANNDNEALNQVVDQYNNGEIVNYNTKSELASILGVNPQTVKLWLHGKNKGYKKYNIKSIEYISISFIKV